MFPLIISKIDGAIFTGEVTSATCPGIDGQLTILRNHTPLITQLSTGEIILRIGDERKTFPIDSGFLSVDKEGATILLT